MSMSCNQLNIHRYISVFRVRGKVVGTGHRSGGQGQPKVLTAGIFQSYILN